jgi:hypothetical protein
VKHKSDNTQLKAATMSVHEDTLQGLHEILEYVKGDKSKARKINALSDTEQDKVNLYVDELKRA